LLFFGEEEKKARGDEGKREGKKARHHSFSLNRNREGKKKKWIGLMGGREGTEETGGPLSFPLYLFSSSCAEKKKEKKVRTAREKGRRGRGGGGGGR